MAGAQASGSGRGRITPVTGARIIAGLAPCNSIADSASFRQALEALDLVVVTDVAMTETGRLADYVLPAASQYEKYECTFFNVEFPRNTFLLRPPVLPPLEGTLPEPEIYARVIRTLGTVEEEVLTSLTTAAADGRQHYRDAFFAMIATRPELMGLAAYLVQETLGPALPKGQHGAAAVWGLAQLCAMSHPDAVRRAGHADGDALFDAIMSTPTVIQNGGDRPPANRVGSLRWRPAVVHEPAHRRDGRQGLLVVEAVPRLASVRHDDAKAPLPRAQRRLPNAGESGSLFDRVHGLYRLPG